MVPGVTVIICDVPVATKLYQTSSSAVPTQPVCDWLAPTDVPEVVEVQVDDGFTVTDVAVLQLSFNTLVPVTQRLERTISLLFPTLATFM
jgi:hypothetical protein